MERSGINQHIIKSINGYSKIFVSLKRLLAMRKFLHFFVASLAVCYLLCQGTEAKAQRNVKDSIVFMGLIMPGASFQVPMGELSRRTGYFFSVGGPLRFKTKKNWLFGVEGYFTHGTKVKEPGLIQNLLTSSGDVIAQNGQFANLNIYFRGWHVAAGFGKLFPWFGPNKNCGVYFMFSPGFIQHRIRFETKGNNIEELKGNYVKGYDRYSGGFAMKQEIGYKYISNNRFISFYLGVEFLQSATKSYRGYNFDTERTDTKTRFDGFFGVKAGWTVPFFSKKATNEVYYR